MTIANSHSRESSPIVESLKTIFQAIKEEWVEPTPETSSSLSLDETLELLSHARRRAVIRHLSNTENSPIPLPELAKQIACDENGSTPSDLKNGKVEQVHIALTHSHLPRLESTAVVIYDTDTMTIAPGPHFEELKDAYTLLRDG